jgi:hypothetical protein
MSYGVLSREDLNKEWVGLRPSIKFEVRNYLK